MVLAGVAVGGGEVRAGGAVGTKDVAPYTMVGGVPAKPIRGRFSPEIAAQLQAIAWWNWPLEKLMAHLADFQSPDIAAFCQRHAV